MKEYESPKAELITFDNENVITSSGCNCYADRWDNEHNADQCTCEGDSYDYEELLMST